MKTDLEKIYPLLASNSENASVALQILKGNPLLKKEVMVHYQSILKASNRKTLKAIPSILEQLKTGKGTLNARLQIGTIPEIHPFIQELYLNGLELKSIPTWVRKLSNLKLLALSGCQLDKLPSWIGELSNLEFFSIATNQIKKIPPSFGNLQNLTTCYLIDNEITTLPNSIHKLAQLRNIYLKKGNPIAQIELRRVQKLLPNTNFH